MDDGTFCNMRCQGGRGGYEMYRIWAKENLTKRIYKKVILRHVREIGSENGRHMGLAQVRVQWQVLVAGSVRDKCRLLVSYNIRYWLEIHAFLNLTKLRYHMCVCVCVCVSAAKSSFVQALLDELPKEFSHFRPVYLPLWSHTSLPLFLVLCCKLRRSGVFERS